ncbi:MAG TPA: outer membrane protein assembly factor BamA [Gemmatimonadaceae bacterium]|jgi:outer membrane protein insertion porin family|nr:outer membrane protein assembly factor BamA [Gemmatimonadaceae bacterium]
MRQLRFLPALLGVFVAVSAARAQDAATGPCATPDSVAFRGQSRIPDGDLRADVGIAPKSKINSRILDRAIRDLYATNNFDENITAVCELVGGKAVLVFNVKERPVLNDVRVTGADRVSTNSVKDRVDLLIGKPINPAQVAKDVARIDSLYQSEGYYLARVKVDTIVGGTSVGGGNTEGATLVFHVDEGHRLAISGVDIEGNRALSDKTIVSAIATKPEGFFWWRNGEFDSDKYAEDLSKNIPALYATHGYIDMQVVKDTLIIDRERGKALVRLTVSEGPRYRIGSFEVNGAKRFSNDDIARFYPFGEKQKGITDAVKGLIRVGSPDDPQGTFNQSAWDAATEKVHDAYENEGYIYASIQPVLERRRVGKDSVPTVDLRWEIDERSPAIVNRVDITGNDVTTESCIRRQLFVIPGDVFNKQRLIDSYRNIANLGFFEQDMAPPDTRQVNDKGDIDIIFHVKEKRTGNVNFGASVGQGYGVGGFVGFDQPNLFGECKRGSLNWQFGKYIKDFSLSYTDPFIKQTNVSGTISAYHQQSRFIIQNIGQSTTTGGQLQIGFPLPNSQTTRFYTSYGGERVKYGGDGLVSTINCNGCFRSTLGFTLDHDTRFGLPFPVSGVHEDVQLQLNGGPLGGTAKYSRLVAEMRGYTPLATFGKGLGPEPMTLLLGLSAKAGALFGDPGPFFVSQAFSLGGVQYGEPLRGYEEFSITPRGYLPNADQYTAQRTSFGNAFYRSTAELGLRVSQQIYLDAFYDAGNLWARPRDFDPTRLFRGAGFGGSMVTPLGPLGVDLGYGFDRVDVNGRSDPKWQVHFKFGQIF